MVFRPGSGTPKRKNPWRAVGLLATGPIGGIALAPAGGDERHPATALYTRYPIRASEPGGNGQLSSSRQVQLEQLGTGPGTIPVSLGGQTRHQ